MILGKRLSSRKREVSLRSMSKCCFMAPAVNLWKQFAFTTLTGESMVCTVLSLEKVISECRLRQRESSLPRENWLLYDAELAVMKLKVTRLRILDKPQHFWATEKHLLHTQGGSKPCTSAIFNSSGPPGGMLCIGSLKVSVVLSQPFPWRSLPLSCSTADSFIHYSQA